MSITPVSIAPVFQPPSLYQPSVLSKAMNPLDFHSLGASAAKQNMIIYTCVILSRIAAASQRSWNEVQEVITRDSIGFSVWFFATPVLHRMALLGLKHFGPEETRPIAASMFHDGYADMSREAKEAAFKGPLGFIKHLNKRFNPLSRYDIVSAGQIEERINHVLKAEANKLKAGAAREEVFEYLRKQEDEGMLKKLVRKSPLDEALKLPKESNLYQFAEQKAGPAVAFLTKTKIARNMVSFTSLVGALLLLGVGIPLFNNHRTRKNVEAGKVGRYMA
jgi:hypothetical protein